MFATRLLAQQFVANPQKAPVKNRGCTKVLDYLNSTYPLQILSFIFSSLRQLPALSRNIAFGNTLLVNEFNSGY